MEKPSITYVNGSAVFHFLEIQETDSKHGLDAVSFAYRDAVNKARDFGGSRFHGQSYGGGIAFQSEDDAIRCFNHFNKKEEIA